MVYWRNIKRLYRLTHDNDEVPLNAKWLASDALFAKYKKLPLKQRRHLSVAGIKVLQVLGVKNDESRWRIAMLEDANNHQVERAKNKKTKKEANDWPKGGLKSISKASKEVLKRLKHKLAEEPNVATLYKYQFGVALRLFTEAPVRNDFATLEIEKNANGNYLDIQPKGNAKLVFRKHKASKKIGGREINLSRGMTTALRKLLKYRKTAGVEHKHLLVTKTGKPLSKAAFGKGLHKVTKDVLNKAFGSRLIRILTATANQDVLSAADKLANDMLHSKAGKQTREYVRK